MSPAIGTVDQVSVDQIVAGDNDRRAFNERALKELAASIEQNGLAQPITVRPMCFCDECGHMVPDQACPGHCTECGQGAFSLVYQIVAGERRFRACSQILDWQTIPAIVRELTDEQADAIMLAENVHRVDLNPIDEGHAYQKRMERHGWTIAKISREANVSEGRVKNRLALLKLHVDIQSLVGNGGLSLGFAEEMSVLDTDRQFIALRWLNQQQRLPSRRVFGTMVAKMYEEQQTESMFDLDSFFVPQVTAAIEQSENGRLYEILPRMKGVPDLPTRKGGIGRILDDYIAELLGAGHREEAKVLVDFWAKLDEANYAGISPFDSKALVLLQQVPA